MWWRSDTNWSEFLGVPLAELIFQIIFKQSISKIKIKYPFYFKSYADELSAHLGIVQTFIGLLHWIISRRLGLRWTFRDFCFVFWFLLLHIAIFTHNPLGYSATIIGQDWYRTVHIGKVLKCFSAFEKCFTYFCLWLLPFVQSHYLCHCMLLWWCLYAIILYDLELLSFMISLRQIIQYVLVYYKLQPFF